MTAKLSEILTGKIDVVAYDFDGVMTDNKVIVHQDGTESVVCNRGDGLGVDGLRALKIPQVILSTEKNPVVAARAKKLQIDVAHGLGSKVEALDAYLKTHGATRDRAVFIGNDINDLAVMSVVGYPLCPADSHPRVKAIARHVFSANGGQGVIREFCETFFPEAL